MRMFLLFESEARRIAVQNPYFYVFRWWRSSRSGAINARNGRLDAMAYLINERGFKPGTFFIDLKGRFVSRQVQLTSLTRIEFDISGRRYSRETDVEKVYARVCGSDFTPLNVKSEAGTNWPPFRVNTNQSLTCSVAAWHELLLEIYDELAAFLRRAIDAREAIVW